MNNTRDPMVPAKGNSILLLLLCLLLVTCYQNLKDDPASLNKVPASIAKKWQTGKYPVAEFWKYNGKNSNKNIDSVLAFDFKPNGECKFYQLAGSDSNGYRMETLICKKGTVRFHNNHSFTFYPSEGTIREFYKFCDSFHQNYNQEVSEKDLTPQTYYYTLKSTPKGDAQFVIRDALTSTTSTILKPVEW